MTASPDVETQGSPNPSASVPRSHRSLWFPLGLVALLSIAVGFSFWASAQPWFVYHVGIPCDILISGDSTSLADLVPSVIEDRTGMKICNIGEVRSVENFTGTHYTFDDYLAHNPPPRFLVTGWTPGALHLEHPPLVTAWTDGFAYATQFARGPWLWKEMLTHPEPTLTFVIWAGYSRMRDPTQRLVHLRRPAPQTDERARRDALRGEYYVVAPQTACAPEVAAFLTNPHAKLAASVAEYRRHYTTHRTQVLVYVTPVADCDPSIRQYLSESQGLGERPLQSLPVSDFNRSDIHLTPERAALYSAHVAEDILMRMGASSAAQPADRTTP